jgi:Uma2 family endonuclease
MSTVPEPRYTPADYLARERAADHKSEYYQGQIFAMAGASLAHNLIAKNLIRRLDEALEGRDCLVLPGDMRVKCPTGLYTYPDVVIACGDTQFDDKQRDTLLTPTVIIEILSPSTEAYDRGKKFEHYRTIPSLKEYVLIAQDRVSIAKFLRPNDAGPWTWTVQIERDESLTLGSCCATLRIADIYAGVEFPPPSAEDLLMTPPLR